VYLIQIKEAFFTNFKLYSYYQFIGSHPFKNSHVIVSTSSTALHCTITEVQHIAQRVFHEYTVVVICSTIVLKLL